MMGIKGYPLFVGLRDVDLSHHGRITVAYWSHSGIQGHQLQKQYSSLIFLAVVTVCTAPGRRSTLQQS